MEGWAFIVTFSHPKQAHVNTCTWVEKKIRAVRFYNLNSASASILACAILAASSNFCK